MSNSPVKFTVKNGFYYLTEGVLEYCIWNDYLEKNTAMISGMKIDTFGLLPVRYFKNRQASAPSWVGTWMVPSMIALFPSSVDTEQKIKIYPSSDEKPYVIARFEAGDRVTSCNLIQDLDNVVLFVEMMLGGRVDCNIPYFKLGPAWMYNQIWNGVSLGVPALTIEMIVATLCRYKGDLNMPFVQYYEKHQKNCSEVDYRFTTVRTICASQSIFGGLSFEDINYMIDYSLNTTTSQRDQMGSPLEQIIKM